MNPDAMNNDELMDFWAKSQATYKLARELFPERPKGYIKATRDLGHYVSNLASARQCRVRGDIVAASSYEEICDRIYDNLPGFARLW